MAIKIKKTSHIVFVKQNLKQNSYSALKRVNKCPRVLFHVLILQNFIIPHQSVMASGFDLVDSVYSKWQICTKIGRNTIRTLAYVHSLVLLFIIREDKTSFGGLGSLNSEFSLLQC